jgi:hypothetical protein
VTLVALRRRGEGAMKANGWAALLGAALALAACGGEEAAGVGATDLGGASAADGAGALDGAAAGVDAGADAGADASADATVGADAAADADVAADAGAAADAAVDADPGADLGAEVTDDAVDVAEVIVDDAGNVLNCGVPCAADQLCQDGACVTVPKPCGGPCPLGSFCAAASDTCQASACKPPVAFPNVQKISWLQIAESSDGCDLNADGKPDNVFGKLLKVYPAANTELQKSVNEGLFVLLLDAPGWDWGGQPFAVGAYLAELDPSNAGCSPTSPDANCKYTVDADNFAGGAGGLCAPQAQISPVKITAGGAATGTIAGGGALDQQLTIVLPVVGGLDFTMSGVRLDGVVSGAKAWTSTSDGRICGVMTIEDFDKAMASIPADAWAELGLDEATIKAVIKAFLNPDVDLNGDGVPDAMSVALRFKSVLGQIITVLD